MNELNRRAFIKKALYLGAGLIAVAGIGVGWKVVKRTLDLPDVSHNPRRPKSEPSQVGLQWFTLAEFATVKALASIIVPSDGNGPGAAEVDVSGQLDQLVAGAPRRQGVYRAGLAAIDGLAMQQYQQIFADLAVKDQIELFSTVDEARKSMEKEPVSVFERASRKMNFLYYYRWLGITPAATDLCHSIVFEVKVKFYSSQLAWDWLGYEGPPFPLGYFSKPDNCHISQS